MKKDWKNSIDSSQTFRKTVAEHDDDQDDNQDTQDAAGVLGESDCGEQAHSQSSSDLEEVQAE